MIGKSNIADCNENCKYEGLYETYKNVHDDIRKKFISQTIVTVLLLFAVTITVVYLLYCRITGKYNDNTHSCPLLIFELFHAYIRYLAYFWISFL